MQNCTVLLGWERERPFRYSHCANSPVAFVLSLLCVDVLSEAFVYFCINCIRFACRRSIRSAKVVFSERHALSCLVRLLPCTDNVPL
jgi:hypothetical protein